LKYDIWYTLLYSVVHTFNFGLHTLCRGSLKNRVCEDILTYTGQAAQLYYNLCNATLANKTPEEARILRQTLKDQQFI
ncbi:Uncharacterized protein FWK35_00037751, partial [Aphis craccivora]